MPWREFDLPSDARKLVEKKGRFLIDECPSGAYGRPMTVSLSSSLCFVAKDDVFIRAR